MQRELTGRKVFAITASAFAVIIGVNILLAVNAVRTFPGLEVRNSYVASQTFDRDRAAQEALGWTAQSRVEAGQLILELTDISGTPVEAATLEGVFGRATNVANDQIPNFSFDGTRYSAPITAGPGNWNLRLKATAADGTLFQQRLQLHLR